MKFGDAIKSFFKNYVNFSGRARRSEYWFAVLFTVLASTPFSIVNGIAIELDKERFLPFVILSSILFFVVFVGLFPPYLSVWVRRIHDTGRSAWNILWLLLPLVGSIIMLVFLVQDSQPGENLYGDPVK